MLSRVCRLIVAFLSLLLVSTLPLQAKNKKKDAAGDKHFTVLNKATLGEDGGWDYLTYDPAGKRLFISRATRVMVVDAASGKKIGEIPDTPGVHGIALAPELNKGFVSNGKESTVTVFQLDTLHVIHKVKTGNTPDAIAYDPSSQRVFTFNARGKDTTAIDAKSDTVAGTIPLGGKPEFAVVDGKGKLFVNIEDKSELVAIDTHGLKEINRWPLTGCQEPSGLAIDKEHRRLFSGCDNKVMAITDADSGHVITTVPIGDGVDANGFDPALGLAFSSNGEGSLTIVHEESPSSFKKLQDLPTQKGARTMALDAANHKVYLVTADFGPAPTATAGNPHPRPSIAPNSFVLITVGPAK